MTEPGPNQILRGNQLIAGNTGVERKWYFWNCGACNERSRYLNEQAMIRASIAHRDTVHKRDPKPVELTTDPVEIGNE